MPTHLNCIKIKPDFLGQFVATQGSLLGFRVNLARKTAEAIDGKNPTQL